MSCLLISSMHTTGCRGSYGRWYTLSTRSMPATKWWLCCFGMHHISRRHGFNSFFLTPAARSPRKSIRPLQVAPALPPAASRSTERGLPVEPNRPPEPDALPSPHPTSSAPEATAEACAPEPSSDPAPRPADARAGRSAPSPPERIHHLHVRQCRASTPLIHGQQNPCTAAASSPTTHDACSTSAQHRFQLIPLILS